MVPDEAVVEFEDIDLDVIMPDENYD